MRLQLSRAAGLLPRAPVASIAAAAALATLSGGPASAQPTVSVDARTGVYQDTDHTFISTSTIALRGTIEDTLTIKGRYLADVVSSASVDVVSAATSHFDELRNEVEGAAVYADGTRTASVAYVFSDENDWTSNSVRAGASRDFFQHRLTVGAGASVTWNDVGRSGDLVFHRDLTQGTGSIDATFVVTKRDLVSVSYSLMVLSGYQASPYRFVFFVDPSVPSFTVGNPETHPDERIRHAASVRWNRHVFTDSAVRSHVRAYTDDWGIVSGTAGLEYVVGLGDFQVGVAGRGYAQKGADFYAPVYATRLTYMTADRELSPFVDVFGGLRAAYRGSPSRLFSELRADIKVEGFYFHYFDFPRLPNRSGIAFEIGLGATF